MFQVTDGHVRKNFAIYLEGKLALTVSVHSELDHLGTAKSAHSTINFGLLGLTKFSLCLRWAEASPCYHLSRDSAADAVIGNVLCNNGASSDDTTVTDINSWHNHRPATKPDVVAYSHGATVFIPLKAHWPFYVTMRMITRVDDHLRAHHHIVADDAGTENLAVDSNSRVIPQRKVGAKRGPSLNINILACVQNESARNPPPKAFC